MKIYIISWLGNDDVREKRKDYHNRQVQWALEKGLEVFVLNQDYNQDDFVSGVTYIGDNTRFYAPGKARNILLREFYKTKDKFAIFADNDAEFRDLSDFDFLKLMEERIDGLMENRVGLITPIDGRQMPFNKEYQANKSYYDQNIVLQKNTQAKGSLTFVRNFALDGNPIYFSEEFEKNNKLIPKEDKEFAFQIFKAGFGCYMCKNIVLRELAVNCSTWVVSEERAAINFDGDELIRKLHPEIPLDNDGKSDYSAYSRTYIFKKFPPKIELPIDGGLEDFF